MTPPRDELDFEDRRLCPDGACIGVLDEHGRCPECGRAWGAAADPFRSGPPPEVVETAVEEAELAAFTDDRELCPDDACIGLIGPNGRCKECGRPR